ncbi:DUF11 domain-containing protein [Umezawaea beigongshangensis]|uniref:DUF11 domain-containing protein n=1 Tax=Umezawaea beigongshangensis TaxID=2780383 RepID=UPI0018F24054|nr:DUF11 domain-containing protein [Umezawaea beigongshangensis]
MSTTVTGVASRAVALAAALTLGSCALATSAVAQPTGDPSSTPTTTTPTATSTSAQVPAPVARPDLRVSATAAPGGHLVGERVAVTVTIVNAGPVAATGVKATTYRRSGSPFFVDSQSWGDLDVFGPGTTVPAGATTVVEVVGSVPGWDGGDPQFTVDVRADDDVERADNQAQVTFGLVPSTTTGTVSGAVFGDRDGDGAFGDGEGLGGVTVVLSGNGRSFEGTTAADGSFSVTGVPARVYSVSHRNVPDGWVVPHSAEQVGVESGTSELLVRAVRPLSDVLSADVEFTADSYRAGAEARVRVTLTNSGPVALPGVHVGCDRSGDGPHVLLADVEDVGDLHWSRPGVTVGAGVTWTFEARGTVPDEADRYGSVFASCDFGSANFDQSGFPKAFDTARVPGVSANTDGLIHHDADGDGAFGEGEGVADTTVGLVDPDSGLVVAESTTGSDGRVEFTAVPAGMYHLRLSGPWRWEGGTAPFIYVGTCPLYCGGGWEWRVVPGAAERAVDPVAAVPATGLPRAAPTVRSSGGGGTTSDDLAFTGVDVAGLFFAGLLALVAGIGAVVIGRRRSA